MNPLDPNTRKIAGGCGTGAAAGTASLALGGSLLVVHPEVLIEVPGVVDSRLAVEANVIWTGIICASCTARVGTAAVNHGRIIIIGIGMVKQKRSTIR